MSVVGLGTDIIAVARIAESVELHGNRFWERILTPTEIAYCQKSPKSQYQRFAGRFAAKEAISKAFGVGIGKEISWKDIEIVNDQAGRPVASMNADLLGDLSIQISISHCKEYATATAILIRL